MGLRPDRNDANDNDAFLKSILQNHKCSNGLYNTLQGTMARLH